MTKDEQLKLAEDVIAEALDNNELKSFAPFPEDDYDLTSFKSLEKDYFIIRGVKDSSFGLWFMRKKTKEEALAEQKISMAINHD